MYAHFVFGFYDNGNINSEFQNLMRRLSKKNGWLVPVCILLDYLPELKGHYEITRNERCRLERRWLWTKIRTGPS